MTFPHGGCNATWLTALRNTGFDAALASRAIPFAHETGLDNPLYEMHPAELGFAGFPMINRFKAEEPVEHLLFQAWLGKPLVIYTHHQFFSEGLQGVTTIARFLNDHVRPRWTDIGTMVAANYQVRATPAGAAVRVFSNRVTLALDRGLAGVVKPSPAAEPARAELDGAELALDQTASGLATRRLEPRARPAEIVFRPTHGARPHPLASVSVLSRVRRAATEVRDQGAPITVKIRGSARTRR